MLVVVSHPDPHDIEPQIHHELTPGYAFLYQVLHEIRAIFMLSMKNVVSFQNFGVSIVPAVKCLKPEKGPPGLDPQVPIRSCLPWLSKQIKLIKPRVIVGMGSTAMSALTGEPVAKCHAASMRGVLAESPVPGTYMSFSPSPEWATHRNSTDKAIVYYALGHAWDVYQSFAKKAEEQRD